MIEHPLISIAVPIYGVEKFIKKCVESVLNQTYDNCEFIFVNDCTQDNSMIILNTVISEYPLLENRIHILNHQKNLGLGGARLSGIMKASGQYISFIDSDDYVEPNYIEKMVDVALSTGADLVVSSVANISKTLQQVNVLKYLKGKCCRRYPARIWGSLLKREILIRNKILPIVSIDHAEDYHVMCKYISECESIYLLQDILYHYNTDNDQSYTQNYSQKSIYSIYKSLSSTSQYLLNKDKNKYSSIVYFANLEFIKWIKINVRDDSSLMLFVHTLLSYHIPGWYKILLCSLLHLPIKVSKVMLKIVYKFI